MKVYAVSGVSVSLQKYNIKLKEARNLCDDCEFKSVILYNSKVLVTRRFIKKILVQFTIEMYTHTFHRRNLLKLEWI